MRASSATGNAAARTRPAGSSASGALPPVTSAMVVASSTEGDVRAAEDVARARLAARQRRHVRRGHVAHVAQRGPARRHDRQKAPLDQAEQRQRALVDLARAEDERGVQAHRLEPFGAPDQPFGVALGLVVAEADRPVVARLLVGDAARGRAADRGDRRRVHQAAHARRARRVDEVARAIDVDLALPRRPSRREVDDRGRVHHRVAAAHRRGERRSVGDVTRDPLELRHVGEDRARRARPRQRAHRVAGADERTRHVRSDEAGRARYEDPHRARSLSRRHAQPSGLEAPKVVSPGEWSDSPGLPN